MAKGVTVACILTNTMMMVMGFATTMKNGLNPQIHMVAVVIHIQTAEKENDKCII